MKYLVPEKARAGSVTIKLDDVDRERIASLATVKKRTPHYLMKKAILDYVAFMPLTHAPMIGRPVEDRDGLRELAIDFDASGYLALYRFEPDRNAVTVLAVKHQREDDYK